MAQTQSLLRVPALYGGPSSGGPPPSSALRTLTKCSPLDGEPIAEVELAGPAEVAAAVEASARAAVSWGRTPVKERVQPLFRFKQLAEAAIDELSASISRENGKTHGEARAEVEKGIEVVEFACSLPQIGAGRLLEVSSGVDCFTRRYPHGVVAGITPFNFPAMVPLWMIPIALACGNAFILKPSEQVPLTPLRLLDLFREAGLPENVLQVVNGDRSAVETLLDHPGVAAAAFVGSTPVAREVHRRGTLAGKTVLALGGAKNHLVVVPDADPEITARNVIASATGCAGQRCMAASVLILVGEAEPILERIVEEGRRIETGKSMGAIISAAARDRIVGYITQAEKEGARLPLDGRGVTVPGREGGSYVGPTIIDGLAPDAACVKDEIFGPVLTVLRVKTLAEALAIENASPFGNAASIYTTSGATARAFADRASAGMIGVNIGVPVPREPFSFGGWNASRFGHGDITGEDGIHFWSKQKKITQKWTAGAASNWMS
ncbi:MAG: CoA-acylating methylmalonate-semialdehyde dehydrogenase [Puniceicoccaceae bacterium]|nr:MAG: CoA-acylating methylmalonate-semialdehyde dehydrogenase [Puniceicoccaceae bacterium]